MNKEDYFDGILKSLSNATDLFDDAEILYNQKRYPRAYTLYQIAIEELGKASLIYSFILYKNYHDIGEQRNFKKEFLSHKKKTSSSIGIDVLLAFHIPEKELKSKIMHQVYEQEKNIDNLNELKNSSLYTDMRKGEFLLPKQVITEKLTSDIQFIAKIRLNVARQFYQIGIDNFDKLQESAKNINEQEMIDNPPEEILELIKFKTGLVIEKK